MLKSGEKYKVNINVNNVNDSHVIAMNYIEPDSIVLDVGCACGDFGVVLKNTKNCLMYGLEYDPDSCEISRKTGAYESVEQFDLNLLSENDFKDYVSKFDYVVCNDILEHLRNPENTIKLLKRYLKPNGAIIASIPNIAHASIKSNLLLNDFTYTKYGVLDETHIRLFTYKSIASMFAGAGLCIEKSCFSFFKKTGLQPNDPYKFLSDEIQSFILEDYHSYVWQYVVKAVVSDDNQSMLYTKNTSVVNINENNAPDYIKKYRQEQLTELENRKKETLHVNNQIQELFDCLKQYKQEQITETEDRKKETLLVNNKIQELFNYLKQQDKIEELSNKSDILISNLDMLDKKNNKYYKSIRYKTRKYFNALLIMIFIFFCFVLFI